MGRRILEGPGNLMEEAEPEISLDARLSALLEAIEAERIPDRLLRLAEELQQELSFRKQRHSPN